MKLHNQAGRRGDQQGQSMTPEARAAREGWEHWIGEANDRIRKILVGDQALMDQSIARIVAKRYTERHHGQPVGEAPISNRRLSAILAGLSDDDRARIQALYQAKMSARDRLAEALGGRMAGETWSGMCQRVRHPWHRIERTAAIMAAVGLYRSSPPKPMAAMKRRSLSEADHEQRAREADEIAAQMVGGR